ncbi:MAG: DNA-directed RNA polymerase subunit omega [Saprospirales bacterium]|jgi:DNA-directed RNA polymerase subunit K/omega|nr:MAG: DNA-directed RNA polymerase subunit omega [Saprospirales bacterium]
MSDIKSKVQEMDPNISPRNLGEMVKRNQNIYETLAVISKRANQLSQDLKSELHSKLEEFAVTSETIEEIQENKEQVEISKFYEKLPNPVIIAMKEYLNEDLDYRYRDED